MGIHQAQQRLAPGQQLIKGHGCLLLQAMQPLRQPQSQQRFSLAALTQANPTAGGGSGSERICAMK